MYKYHFLISSYDLFSSRRSSTPTLYIRSRIGMKMLFQTLRINVQPSQDQLRRDPFFFLVWRTKRIYTGQNKRMQYNASCFSFHFVKHRQNLQFSKKLPEFNVHHSLFKCSRPIKSYLTLVFKVKCCRQVVKIFYLLNISRLLFNFLFLI